MGQAFLDGNKRNAWPAIVTSLEINRMHVGGVSSGELLKQARRRAGLTQAQLGVNAGLPQSVISAYERDRRHPSVEMLGRLVAAAGFDLRLALSPSSVGVRPFAGPVGAVLQHRRDMVRELLTERGITNVEVFGSVARGTDRPDSDVDLVGDVPASMGLWGLNRAAIDLEEVLGVAVDLVPRSAMKARVAAGAAEDLVPL